MIVHVTRGTIDRGEPKSCGFCPVALALERATGEPWVVHEHRARPRFSSGYDPGSYRSLPEAVIEFIKAFDAGLPCEPLSFEFDCVPVAPTENLS